MSRLLRVLIIEDSSDDALFLVRELRRAGYELAEADRAELAGSVWRATGTASRSHPKRAIRLERDDRGSRSASWAATALSRR